MRFLVSATYSLKNGVIFIDELLRHKEISSASVNLADTALLKKSKVGPDINVEQATGPPPLV